MEFSVGLENFSTLTNGRGKGNLINYYSVIAVILFTIKLQCRTQTTLAAS